MISFIIPRNRVLDTGIKKEPYRYRILDTRFYTISCILYSTRATRVWLIYHFDFEVDGGYSGVNFQLDVASNLNATVQVAKRNELHRFEVMPQRWVVERSFSWLENCRRLWKNCERQLTTSLQMVVLAFLALLLKRF